MAVNWAWQEGWDLHQLACPRAYMPDADCLCMDSGHNQSHLIPKCDPVERHAGCFCFPSPVGWDNDGNLIWQHQEIQ